MTMAEQTLKATTPDTELGDLLRCPICQDVCDQPRILSCQHIVCTGCINDWIQAKKGQLWCPECNQQRELPKGGAESLPHSFRLNNICGILREKSELEEERTICKLHGKALDLICFECETTVCVSCSRSDHSDHFCSEAKEVIELAAGKKEERIKSSLIRINQLEQELLKNKEDGLNVMKDFQQRFEFAYQHLFQEMEKVYEKKTKDLESQKKDLENVRDGLREISKTSRSQERIDVNVAVDQIKSFPNEDSLRPNTTSLLKVEIDDKFLKKLFSDGETKCGKVMTSGVTDPSKSCIEVISGESTAGRPVGLQLVLKDDQGRKVITERGEVLSVKVCTIDGQTVSLETQKAEGGHFLANFTPAYPGRYIVKAWAYEKMISKPSLRIKVGPRWKENPKICGTVPFVQPHDVLKVGDSFVVVDKMVVMIDKAGKITKSFANNDWYFYPYSVAMYDQCYYVTAMKGQVVIKYNAVGGEMKRFGGDVLKKPTGVAVDIEGNIFVADSQLSKIFVFHPDGKLQGELENTAAGTVSLNSPWFIKFNKRGHLVIADFENKRVQVRNSKTGVEIMSIYVELHGHDMYCRGVDVDRNDNIYVAARKERGGQCRECILAYNPDGTNLGLLLCPDEDQLNWVRGLHISKEGAKDILYIVNGGDNKSSSKCIRSFEL